jgi:hypothetical protein
MHEAKAAGAGSIAQNGDFVNEDKSSTGGYIFGISLLFRGLSVFGTLPRNGSVPCRESSFLAASLANHCGRGLCNCGGKKKR